MKSLLYGLMRRQLLPGLLLLLLSLSAQGQQFNYHRDFKQLLALSQDSNSSLYYPQLLKRFLQNDSTLTDAEVLALQIGHTVHPDYYPYKTLAEERRIRQLIQAQEYEAALAACNKLLQKNPLNLTALMEKSLASRQLGHGNPKVYRHQYLKLVSAVLSSGDGSAEQPFFVLNPLDGQTLIERVLGGSVGSMGSSTDPNDYYLDVLEFRKEGKEPVMLYFNVAHAHARMFSEEEKAEIQKALEDDDVLTKARKKRE